MIVTKRTFKEQHSASWAWKADRGVALDFLAKVAPYLREPKKKRRAYFLLEQYPLVTRRNGLYTPVEEARKAVFENDFFAL